MELTPKDLIKELWFCIKPKRQRQFLFLLLIMLFASFSEILSIGAVLPFLGVLTNPEHIFKLTILHPIFEILNINKPEDLLFPLTIIFGFTAIAAGSMRLLLLWTSTKLSFSTGADFGIDIYRRTLYQNYAVHCSRNSSEIINGITGKSNTVIYGVILPIVAFISSIVMFVGILTVLVIINPVIAFIAFSGFGLIYLMIIGLSRKQLIINSKNVADESTSVIKSLQEGLGGIRDVLIDGSQEVYCQIYQNADSQMRRSQGNNLFISQSPRYAMEALGMVLIASLAYSLEGGSSGIVTAIPILGALALGAQRLLPILQQIYSSWSTIQANQASLKDVLKLLKQPLPLYMNKDPSLKLPFNSSIELKQISFTYGTGMPIVLNEINLTIKKGDRVGFIGSTGSGKSTLLDIIMGLLQPSKGTVEIDNELITENNQRLWQKHIAHVPQSIYLSDSSIEENIAFGLPKEKIDFNRIKQSAEQARIKDLVESLPQKFKTLVGERGIRLSGGQRQRIGIARALYKNADVIIFDEATSALDNKTENEIMNAIENLSENLTILVIAHRLTTLKNCSYIVKLENGTIKKIGSYQEMIASKS
jgi:ABC-type multidrug transport system fused ATPase/permease subunit